MTALMEGKRGLIMGVANDHSIAWGIAKTLAAHGATLAFTYQGEALGRRVKPLAESLGSKLILPCDVEDIASVDAVFGAIEKQWGGLDFLVHAIGFSDKKTFALAEDKALAPFRVLQSTSDPELVFVVLDPSIVVKDYAHLISSRDWESVAIADPSE